MSDTSLKELHEFARKMGFKPSWFQAGSTPHYDVTKSQRGKAIALGAVPIDRYGTVQLIEHWREHFCMSCHRVMTRDGVKNDMRCLECGGSVHHWNAEPNLLPPFVMLSAEEYKKRRAFKAKIGVANEPA